MKDSIRIEVEMEQKMCSVCKKTSGEYYELELHLRYKYFEDIMKIKERTLNLLQDNFPGITKVDEVDNGFNIRFISKGDMNKITTLFSKYYFLLEKRSSKLVGRDNLTSKDTYRHNLSILLIDLKVGDIVSVKGEKFRIKAVNKGTVLVLNDLETGRKKVVSYSIIEDYFELIEKKKSKPE